MGRGFERDCRISKGFLCFLDTCFFCQCVEVGFVMSLHSNMCSAHRRKSGKTHIIEAYKSICPKEVSFLFAKMDARRLGVVFFNDLLE